MYCFDTDVLSATTWRQPPLALIRRLALVPADQQHTTAITVGEMVYGVAKKAGSARARLVRDLVDETMRVLPFDARAGRIYGELRADLERSGTPLAEPDLRIAAIALCHDLTMVTGNDRHFARVSGLRVENWLSATS